MINIYCIVAKTKCGKDMILRGILADKNFVSTYNLKVLKYGTTKIKHPESNCQSYYTISLREANMIDQNDLVEMRSYYTLTEGEVKYFTKISDLLIPGNYICIAAPYQYEMYKEWCNNQNIINGSKKYNLRMIFVDSDIEDRIKRMQNTIRTENDFCEVSRRIIQDKNDFDMVGRRLEEISYPMNNSNVCYIKNGYDNISPNISKIKNFIKLTIEN